MEECGECLKTVTEKFQIPEAEDSSPPKKNVSKGNAD